MEQGGTDSKELQLRVGVSEELTDDVLRVVQGSVPTAGLLPVLNLLMLERPEATMALVRRVVEASYDGEYIASLQKSRFYMQRMAVPQLVGVVPADERAAILTTSLRDSALPVVREAVRAIVADNPFSDEEVLKIARNLGQSKYSAARTLAVDVLVLGRDCAGGLLKELLGGGWRVRLRCAALMAQFSPAEQETIVAVLISDPVDEVRIQLARNLKSLDYIHLLKDSCEHVRSAYLENVIGKIQDERLFADLVTDKSWEIRRQLLGLSGEMFQNIAVPLIKTSADTINWRLNFEILSLIDGKIADEHTVRLLVDFLFKRLCDRICAVREKARDILVKIIGRYSWAEEYRPQIEGAAGSPNYLYRISAVPVAVSYDRKYKTSVSRCLETDRVENVRLCYSDYLKAEGGDAGGAASGNTGCTN